MNTHQKFLRLISEIVEIDLSRKENHPALLDDIFGFFVMDAGSLLLLSGEQANLLVKETGGDAIWVEPAALNWEDGLVERCIRSNAGAILDTSQARECLDVITSEMEIEPGSAMCAPIFGGKRPLGALVLMSKQADKFETEDLERLSIVAQVLGREIEHCNRIQELQVANSELEIRRWQLLHSRNTLRALFDSIPASIYIIDRRYTLTAVNLQRAQVAKSPPNKLVGGRCYQVLFGREDICPDCRVVETFFSGQGTTRIKHISLSDPSADEWEISTYPIHDEDDQIVQAILIEQDVTEKHHLELILAQSERLAAVGQLAAGLAHEMNNPLTAIIANAQLLKRELPADDDRQDMVDLITLAGERAEKVVRSLLDLARKKEFAFAPTQINETVRNAIKMLQYEISAREVTLLFEASEDLPEISASPDHLQGVWMNLISNALDAFERGGGEVRLSTRREGREVCITVSDNGTGIPAENLEHIFEPFYTTKQPGRGTGLGLSVCNRIVRQHGGRIAVDSELGAGSTFSVYLPIE